MPLIINKKIFNLDNIEDAIIEIKKLPIPNIKPRDTVNVNQEQMVLALEREMAYVDVLDPRNQIQYLGGKHVSTCIMLYISGGIGDHFIMHVSEIEPVDLAKAIGNFKDKKNIKVSLAGGLPDNQTSHKVLIGIVKQLIIAAAQPKNLTITIVSQKILNHNKHTSNDRRNMIFDRMTRRIQDMYFFLFKENFDPKEIEDIKPQHLDNLRGNDFQKNEKLSLLFRNIFFISTVPIEKLKELPINLKTTFKNKKEFLTSCKRLFSKETYDYYNYIFSKFSGSHSDCFVFDIKTGDIIILSHNTFVPCEAERLLNILTDKNRKYFFCFNQQNYINYPLDIKLLYFLKGYLNDKKTDNLMSGKLSRRDLELDIGNFFQKTFDINCANLLDHDEVIDPFAQLIMHFPEVKKFESKFFQDLENTYLPKDIVSQGNLDVLKEITGVNFLAKQRHHPEFVVDAIFVDNGDADFLDKIKKELDGKKINSHRMTYKKKECLCVPGINISLTDITSESTEKEYWYYKAY